MDTSEQYIKMCEKAEEIQPCLDDEDGVGGTWVSGYILYHTAPMNHPHDKDGYYHVTDEMATRRCEQCGNEDDYIKSSRAIWLPRQDQLQAMSGYTWVEFDTLCLATAGRYGISAILTSLETKEQAGIIVVMLEKYGKVWNGEDWRV